MISATCTKTRITLETAKKDFSVSNIRNSASTDGLYNFAVAVNSLQVEPIEKIIKYQEFLLLEI